MRTSGPSSAGRRLRDSACPPASGRHERVPPGEERDRERDAAERARDDERREGEEEPEAAIASRLCARRIDREVDPVRAGASREAREPAPDRGRRRRTGASRSGRTRRGSDGAERAAARVASADEPGEEPRRRTRDRPEHDPDEVGDREEEAEENGETRPLEVVRRRRCGPGAPASARTAPRGVDPTSGSAA